MPYIHLIVTGDLERLALPSSLQRYFPGVDFGIQKVNGTTTGQLPPTTADRVPASMQKLATAMLAALETGPKGHPADFVFAVDDLELYNLHQPEVVTSWVRRAVRERIDSRYSALNARQRAYERVRQRCSFHLFSPMSEAYFFGDRVALSQAGIPASIPIHITSVDLEDFATNDAAYLSSSSAEQRRNNSKPTIDPARHPKDYVEFLCEQCGGFYDETTNGRRALERIEWQLVMADSECIRFARALFQDLADALESSPPSTHGRLHPITYPDRHVDRATLVLRNL